MSFPAVVVIDENTQDPVGELLGALSPENTNPSQIVEFCVDMDLTGHRSIPIWDNRALIASKWCRRSARRLGPRIFVRDERGREPLFVIRGDNVLISGFRLEGPTNYIGRGDRKEKGIAVSPYFPRDGEPPPIRHIDICNMEVFHWSGVGIQVVDNVRQGDTRGRGRLFNTNPGAVRVRRSYFHHNRHGAGEGYGVASSGGAYVTIEQNVFDENRHAIAGGSKHNDAEDYSGYTARENLILEGGGVHCIESGARNTGFGGLIGAIVGGVIGGLIGGVPGAAIGAALGAAFGAGAVAGGFVCWQTHQIDMHGTQSSSLLGEHCCGTAGETMIIERNTILYDGGALARDAGFGGLIGGVVGGVLGGLFGGLPGAAIGAAIGVAIGGGIVILLRRGYAIKIRGNPIDKALVDTNVFRHESWGDAVSQNGESSWYGSAAPTNPVINQNNVFDCGDLTSELGQGDFADDIDCGITTEPDDRDDRGDFGAEVGDVSPEFSDGHEGDPGPKDDFMGTGVTWWARSRATGQWRYLNTMPERLPELQLGKFDDDEIWDVAPRTRHPEAPPEKYSKSGTSGWISRDVIHP